MRGISPVKDSTNDESGPAREQNIDAIAVAEQLLRDFDNTPQCDMTPLFYQHGFEELNMVVRDLLRHLGHDPDASAQP